MATFSVRKRGYNLAKLPHITMQLQNLNFDIKDRDRHSIYILQDEVIRVI